MSTPTAARVRENGDAHWYDREGNPRHRVPKADGKGERATTIRDAVKNGWLPSVTTVIKETLAAPALTAWIAEQAALAVLTAPRGEDEPLDAFVKRVLQEEKQQNQERDAAADFGSNVHGMLEASFQGRTIVGDARAMKCVQAALSLPLLKGRVVATERTIVGDGYAGKYDAEMDNDDPFLDLLDFKTCKKLPDPKYGAWDEHKMQLSAYAAARASEGNIGSKRIRTFNIYISTTAPGEVLPVENPPWEETFEQAFKPLLSVWQWKRQYKP